MAADRWLWWLAAHWVCGELRGPCGAANMVPEQKPAAQLPRVPDAAPISEVLEETPNNALCLGPALGLGAAQAELVRVALRSRRMTVLDADALSLIAGDPGLADDPRDVEPVLAELVGDERPVPAGDSTEDRPRGNRWSARPANRAQRPSLLSP